MQHAFRIPERYSMHFRCQNASNIYQNDHQIADYYHHRLDIVKLYEYLNATPSNVSPQLLWAFAYEFTFRKCEISTQDTPVTHKHKQRKQILLSKFFIQLELVGKARASCRCHFSALSVRGQYPSCVSSTTIILPCRRLAGFLRTKLKRGSGFE